jgi:predicted O-linked N-acetylglucosamine transferase (SPINDLY family)
MFSQGHLALSSGNAPEAYLHWKQCLQCLPDNPLEYRRLANAFRSIGHITEASELIAKATKKSPQSQDLIADQASLLLDVGEGAQAFDIFSTLAEKSFENMQIEAGLGFLSNALMAMEYAQSIPDHQKKVAATNWGNWATRWSKAISRTENIPAWSAMPNRNSPLRIGLVSGDLCDHPVGFLLLPLLQYYPKDRGTFFIYDNGSRIDNTHRQLRAAVKTDHWRIIHNQTDTNATKSILEDRLDVIIDLSGHTGRSRLRLMAHRLANCQLSWLGYSGTTGLSTIDGVILDNTLSHGIEKQFIETIHRISPSRFCFRPPFSPPVQAPPCIKNGYITCGCFNNTSKYNPTLFFIWAKILKQVPQSRLILKWRTFADKSYREKIEQEFAKHGIEAKRIECRGFSTHRAMLDEYNDLDIALDTFPFNGGFTSLESLWMGLPLITLCGTSPIAKQSASFLKALDLTTWIAYDTDSYVQAAVRTAADKASLIRHREKLRFQIMGSPLYDAPAFSLQFSSMLESLVNKSRLKNQI